MMIESSLEAEKRGHLKLLPPMKCTQHGQIPTWFSHSDVTPCGSNLLLSPSAVPDVELSVRTAARQEVGPARTKCTARHRIYLAAAVAISGRLSVAPNVMVVLHALISTSYCTR